jgi:hypothetical protein
VMALSAVTGLKCRAAKRAVKVRRKGRSMVAEVYVLSCAGLSGWSLRGR